MIVLYIKYLKYVINKKMYINNKKKDKCTLYVKIYYNIGKKSNIFVLI